jgi:hypothetical protein
LAYRKIRLAVEHALVVDEDLEGDMHGAADLSAGKTPSDRASPRVSAIVPLFGGFRRHRVAGSCRGLADRTFNSARENFALSIQPIDVCPAVGLTIGDPEVVGTLADGLF